MSVPSLSPSRSWLVGLLAVILLSLVIWFAGPYVAIAERKPFEPITGRLVGVLIIVIAWALIVQLRLMRATRKGEQLVGGIAKQEEDDNESSRRSEAGIPTSRDSAALRDRFQRAVAALKKTHGTRSLYELPWYMLIGPPGTGKTTALLNAGLRFPLENEFGRDPLKGVGGTRNCDWWITDEAILLDTAGRFTTQDSNQVADRAGWLEFLGLLRKYRRRRPINGVLLAVSLSDLMQASRQQREQQAAAIRQRLEELHQQLGMAFPVYLLLTKADLIAGFNEYFDDLNQKARAQVWGATFPMNLSRSGQISPRLRTEFDALVAEIQDRMIVRLGEESDINRRLAIQAFPSQVAAIKGLVCEFLDEILRGARFNGNVWLRGCYLTSGTQDGTPIDRVMSALNQNFSLAARPLSSSRGSGKAFFLEHLIKKVVLAESGIAGVNRRWQMRESVLQMAAYLGVGALTLLGSIGLFWSYRANRAYVDEVWALAKQVLPDTSTLAVATDPVTAALPRLDALRLVLDTASEHQASGVPWSMRFGLYRGHAVTELAEDAYRRSLNVDLGPWAATQLEGRLRQSAAQPEQLYEYLRAYVMLGQPQRIERTPLMQVGNVMWSQTNVSDPGTMQTLASHFSAWIDNPSRVRPVTLDQELVAQARISLEQASVPLLMYSRLKLAYASQTEVGLRLDRELGAGADAVFVRRSGASLSEPLSALYTRQAFDDFNSVGRLQLIKQFGEESWVFGDRAPRVTQLPALANQVLGLYEADYSRSWKGLLGDLAVRPSRDARDMALIVGLLGSPTSPLKRLLVLVEQHTNLLKPATNNATSAATTAIDKLASGVSQLDPLAAGGQAAPPMKPGAAVTRDFEAYHKLVEGPAGGAPIDQILTGLVQLKRQIDDAERAGAGGAGAVTQAMEQLEIMATQLPGPVGDIIKQTGGSVATEALNQARTELGNRYVNEVVRSCRDLLGNRYPLSRFDRNEVTPGDFARVFGVGGVYDTFFQTHLLNLVHTSSTSWRWKQESEAVASLPLMPFQQARDIRTALFRPGSATPEVQVTLMPEFLDAEVNKVIITIDGQSLEYSHGPQRALTVTWPGTMPTGATVVFEDRNGSRPNLQFPGAWGLFRLFDAAQVQRLSDTRFVLTLTREGRSVRLAMTASSVLNPFARPQLLRFSCG